MAVTGKYDFTGIKKWGAKGISLALATTTWGAWLLKYSFGPVLDYILELIVGWMANKGLIILNIGAIYVSGEIDQHALDKAIDQGLEKIKNAGGKLSEKEIKDIDDAVIKAANEALPYGNTPPKP